MRGLCSSKNEFTTDRKLRLLPSPSLFFGERPPRQNEGDPLGWDSVGARGSIPAGTPLLRARLHVVCASAAAVMCVAQCSNNRLGTHLPEQPPSFLVRRRRRSPRVQGAAAAASTKARARCGVCASLSHAKPAAGRALNADPLLRQGISLMSMVVGHSGGNVGGRSPQRHRCRERPPSFRSHAASARCRGPRP